MINSLHSLCRLLLIAAVAGATASCFFRLNTVEGPPSPEAARAFADKYVSLLLAGKYDEMYGEMDPVFKETYQPDVISKTIESLYGYFGQALETEYKTEELLNWQYPDGTQKVTRKLWYKMKTTKADYGQYFLEVTAVKRGDKIHCLSFKMLEFPAGTPEQLR